MRLRRRSYTTRRDTIRANGTHTNSGCCSRRSPEPVPEPALMVGGAPQARLDGLLLNGRARGLRTRRLGGVGARCMGVSAPGLLRSDQMDDASSRHGARCLDRRDWETFPPRLGRRLLGAGRGGPMRDGGATHVSHSTNRASRQGRVPNAHAGGGGRPRIGSGLFCRRAHGVHPPLAFKPPPCRPFEQLICRSLAHPGAYRMQAPGKATRSLRDRTSRAQYGSRLVRSVPRAAKVG